MGIPMGRRMGTPMGRPMGRPMKLPMGSPMEHPMARPMGHPHGNSHGTSPTGSLLLFTRIRAIRSAVSLPVEKLSTHDSTKEELRIHARSALRTNFVPATIPSAPAGRYDSWVHRPAPPLGAYVTEKSEY